MILDDTEEWQRQLASGVDAPEQLQLVAGVDLSFIKGDDVSACVGLVVLNYPQLEVVYEDMHMTSLTEPYIPGFLAFREAPPLVAAYRKLIEQRPELTPQLLMVDGNGILHPRGFGLGCQLGVTLDVPTVGVAKHLFHVDGLENSEHHKRRIADLREPQDWFPLVGDSGATLGAALRSTAESTNPVYVSVGHRISLSAALRVVARCCKKRVPEPTRQADLRSREFLRQLEEKEKPKQHKTKPKQEAV